MSVTDKIYTMLVIIKPALTKVIPLSYLQKKKLQYVNWSTKRLNKVKLKAYDKSLYPHGVNLIGPIQDQTGLGQSCRLLANALDKADVPHSIIEHHITKNRDKIDHTFDSEIVDEQKYDINIFHINMHEFAYAFKHFGKKYWDYHYNIGYWLWELEEFPEEWVGCISVLDEIWTPSEFVSNSIRKVTDKPVRTIPYIIEAPIDSKYDRAYFNLPEDKFLYLMMYASDSMTERKNPIGALEAFKRAFDKDDESVGLVIKLNGNNQDDIDYISSFLDGYKNVYFMTDRLTKIEVNSLISDVDVFVSLHRAEGFGLVMAEAMLNGTPCIATNWSANTEFMNDEVACMVKYTKAALKEKIGPYKKGSVWAEPDIDSASGYMKKLYEDSEYRNRLTENARKYISDKLGENYVTSLIKEAIGRI
ncbi:Glycosyltransferase involved in cell wall bisynthesis [Pseudobutyrivibrio sp. NOR37]|uniref:Glycosyltransferase family 4 protein n=1 Tax=Pseudobutyrivibrio xylanivorans TaxID=185007 RepID=A0A6M0LK15_PSEXY|nr:MULTISPECIES: glycosyltransferase family 4 protein [Pseudobutyrivibrio]NEX02293.1 glycosyltransferase family 4 protein [Pseudobutyrivibrio xylanivorans]SFR77828.1 Glycosyltransferase involved in cell wall bisynthesis [Pseudobutyrivibrio sp. NOR37]